MFITADTAYHAYLIVNLINGKQYVGIFHKKLRSSCIQCRLASCASRHRWRSHVNCASKLEKPRRLLFAAIKEFGPENFSFQVIASASSWKDLCELEKILIQQYGSFFLDLPGGYNMTLGGDGNLGMRMTEAGRTAFVSAGHSPEAIKKKTISNTGLKRSGESLENIRASFRRPERNAKISSTPRSPELRERMRQSLIAALSNPEVRARRSAARLGEKPLAAIAGYIARCDADRAAGIVRHRRKRTPEERAAMSAIAKMRPGRPQSDAEKAKRSKSLAARSRQYYADEAAAVGFTTPRELKDAIERRSQAGERQKTIAASLGWSCSKVYRWLRLEVEA